MRLDQAVDRGSAAKLALCKVALTELITARRAVARAVKDAKRRVSAAVRGRGSERFGLRWAQPRPRARGFKGPRARAGGAATPQAGDGCVDVGACEGIVKVFARVDPGDVVAVARINPPESRVAVEGAVARLAARGEAD